MRTTMEILGEAKKLAREYYALTKKPLGITGEVAEYEAARILGVELAPARQAGHDATEGGRRLQIKGRCLLPNCKRRQQVGSIKTKSEDWDAVLLVLLDEDLNATEIYEAERTRVLAALAEPGPGGAVSKARNERGSLAVSKFKAIGELRWRRPAV
jgi:hypothetical protein